MKGICFFDVDGTLLSAGNINVSQSTIEAMKILRAKDYGVMIATGRHPLELKQLGLLQYNFDGYVLLNGQLCLDSTMTPVYKKIIEGSDREEILSHFDRMAVPMILVEETRLYMNFHNDYVRTVQAEISSPVYDIGTHTDADIYMATIFVPRGEEIQFTNLQASRWHDYAMDVFLPNSGKVAGIKALMEKVGVKQSDIIAFGDGDNDIEMLEFAGLGVAMGNAPDNVKRIANMVTDDSAHDGIYNVVKNL